MREVNIWRADGEVEPVLIRIEHEAPGLPSTKPGDYAQRASARFASEGAALAGALWESCPGGTLDALIAALLVRRGSLFRVAFPKENPRG